MDTPQTTPSPPGRRRRALRCDFCGEEAERVRRVALDRGYDRLGVRHVVRYACETCSEAKESERRGRRGAD